LTHDTISNPEAEQSVLGAILVRPEVMGRVADVIEPTDFYREAHGRIFQAMLDLYGKGDPVDLVTVNALLKERGQLDGIGGPGFLASLSEQVGFATNAEHYAKIVLEKSLIRQVQVKCQQILTQSKHPIENTADFLQLVESQIFEVTQSYNGNGLRRQEKEPFDGVGDLILEVADFVKIELKPKKVIINPWVTEHAIILIYGLRGVGKTMFVIGLVNAITSGAPFGPWETITPASCLYLDGEMPPQDTAERFNFLAKHNRKEKLFIYSDAYVNSLGIPGANLLNEEWRQAMQEILTKKNIKVWIVDNIASLAPGIDENSKQEWDPINKWFLELRSVGITTIFLHHANKDGGQRGTSGREDNIDISVLLERPKNYTQDQGARFVVKFEKARIRHNDLHLIGDTEFALETAEDGSYDWTFRSLKKQTKVEVIKMLDAATPSINIAKELGVTKGRISQIKNEAVKEGLITDKGKLTQSGLAYVQKN
jgi:hypothetical protein